MRTVDGLVFSSADEKNRIDFIADAITTGKDIVFTYHKPDGRVDRRRVTPVKLFSAHYPPSGERYYAVPKEHTYLNGHCHLRHDDRNFRIDRMSDLAPFNQ